MLQEKHGQWEMWISEVVHRRERQKKLEADVSPEFPSLTTGGILSEGQSREASEAKQSCWVRSAFVNQLTYWSAQIGLWNLTRCTMYAALLVPADVVGKTKRSPAFESLRVMSLYFGVTTQGFWSPKDSPSPSVRHPAAPQSYLHCRSTTQQNCLWTLSAVLHVCRERTGQLEKCTGSGLTAFTAILVPASPRVWHWPQERHVSCLLVFHDILL